jgi:hypothetical protein
LAVKRNNREKKKLKQDKKKLAPAPSPLAFDQHGKPVRLAARNRPDIFWRAGRE